MNIHRLKEVLIWYDLSIFFSWLNVAKEWELEWLFMEWYERFRKEGYDMGQSATFAAMEWDL